MAHITEFVIEGLAGHKGTFSCKLNTDVNVFYGENGSGKTTLLKILHAALAWSTTPLRKLPFESAEIKLYLMKFETLFTRSIVQKREPGSPGPTSETTRIEPEQVQLSFLEPPQREWGWDSSPSELRDAARPWKHGYLPISRLYRGLSPSGSFGRKLSEEELDQAFADSLQQLWSSYYTDISSSVQTAQETGLAKILQAVLSTSDTENSSEIIDPAQAYHTVAAFLGRQPKFANVLGTEVQFQRAFQQNAALRKVASRIDEVEKRLQVLNAPREQLRELINEMFRGRKQVVFEGKEITINAADEVKIGLPLLSSGEKQLLLLALEALVVSNHILIIDEPELSMHIDWQRRLVSVLMKLNPRMQLIVATHSPEIMADLPDHQIFRIWGD